MRLRHRLIDLVLAPLLLLVSPILVMAARWRWWLRFSRQVQDAVGVTIVRNHYYEPVLTDRDLRAPSDQVRFLPGLDLNHAGQLAILDRFDFAEELRSLDGATIAGETYRYANQRGIFAQGDADCLYSFVRTFKPATLIEIGCGQSSIVAQIAARQNRAEQPGYALRHVCIEPFHNGWLRRLGPEYRAERVQDIDLSLFRELKPNDMVFIDSTHVIRAQGDVEHEYLKILPVLPVGVFVQVHDIFTPRDYTKAFLRGNRRFWTEQYILEAFLSHNSSFEVALALNDLHKRREPKLYAAIPVLASMPDWEPGSFWIRRRA
jgi:hypothetical protein